MAGAAGDVLKQIRGCDLVGAVRVVASGRSLLDPRATSKAMARLRDEADRHDPLAGLTARERKILELIGDGRAAIPGLAGHHRTRSRATYADFRRRAGDHQSAEPTRLLSLSPRMVRRRGGDHPDGHGDEQH